jgi:hypothetical protein
LEKTEMNAVVTKEPRAPKPPIVTGGKVSAIVPQDIEQTFRLAQAISNSGMSPKSYNNDPNKILVGIIAGMEIGLTPMAALQSIAVIGNMPAIWGDGALALVQGSGLLTDLEETDDGHTATCRAVRDGNPTPIIRSFSMDQAKLAGLAGKSGPWTQYPARMRQMRARLLVLRDGFADVLKGIRMAEEVQDYPPNAFNDASTPRLTRAALADHAGGILEAEFDDATDQFDQSPQPSTSDFAPPVDDPAAVTGRADEPEQKVEAGSSNNPLWRTLVEGLAFADNLPDVEAFSATFDANEDEIPIDRLAEVQDAIIAARARFTGGQA